MLRRCASLFYRPVRWWGYNRCRQGMKAMDDCLEPPILVFGGPYANLRAVDALRERASKLGIVADHCICTGDVVADCTEPDRSWRSATGVVTSLPAIARSSSPPEVRLRLWLRGGDRVRPPRQELVSSPTSASSRRAGPGRSAKNPTLHRGRPHRSGDPRRPHADQSLCLPLRARDRRR